ncbi:MAG: hypothetical protein GXP14_14030 [Gammaproteobacteria bacterium]|nr:hypothetical protein [Gammaproteobacteria bacterium]
MKKDDVPQDNNRTYGGHKKVIYAVNDAGEYEKIRSTGWEAEEFVTLLAVNELNEQALAAYHRVNRGESSPLEYHMYAKRLDILGLSQATGFFQWQIKRHIKPAVFLRLSGKARHRYLDVLGLTVAEFQSIPEQAPAK